MSVTHSVFSSLETRLFELCSNPLNSNKQCNQDLFKSIVRLDGTCQLNAISEYDLFLAWIDKSKPLVPDALPPLEGELLKNFKEILSDTFKIALKDECGQISSVPVNIKELLNVLSQPNPNSSNQLQTLLDAIAEVYGSAAYNLIPIAWYYLYLSHVNIGKELHDSYLVQTLLFQFIRRSTQAKTHLVNVFQRINDLDLRVRISGVYFKRSLLNLQQRVDDYIKGKVSKLDPNFIPQEIVLKKKFVKWGKPGDRFLIRTFNDATIPDNKKEIDWVLMPEEAPQPLCLSDGLIVPIQTLALETDETQDIKIQPFSMQIKAEQTLALRIAKVMVLESAKEKSHATLWIILSNFTEEMRLFVFSNDNENKLLELWKTTLLFAGFESGCIDILGDKISSELKKDYRYVSFRQLEEPKDLFFNALTQLTTSQLDKLTLVIALGIFKRVEDHSYQNPEACLYILIQLGVLLRETKQAFLFSRIASHVVSRFETSYRETVKDKNAQYRAYISAILRALKNEATSLNILLNILILSNRIEASLPKADPTHAFCRTVFTPNMAKPCLQKLIRMDAENLPLSRCSHLLPAAISMDLLIQWLDQKQKRNAISDLWNLFYAGLLENDIDLSAVSSHRFYRHELQDVQLEKEKIIALIKSKDDSKQAIGFWLLICLFLEESQGAKEILENMPLILLNPWMGSHKEYFSKCKSLLNVLMQKVCLQLGIKPTSCFVNGNNAEEALANYPFATTIAGVNASSLYSILRHYGTEQLKNVEYKAIHYFLIHPQACQAVSKLMADPLSLWYKVLLELKSNQELLLSYIQIEIAQASTLSKEGVSILEYLIKHSTHYPKAELEKLLATYWDKRDGLTKTLQWTLWNQLILLNLASSQPLKCVSYWPSAERLKLINWDHAEFVQIFVDLINALMTMRTPEATVNADNLISQIPAKKQWKTIHESILQCWVEEHKKLKDQLRDQEYSTNTNAKWRMTYLVFQEYVQEGIALKLGELADTLFSLASCHERKILTVRLCYQAFEAILTNGENQARNVLVLTEWLNNSQLMSNLDFAPVYKISLLFVLVNHVDIRSQACAQAIKEILKTLESNSEDLIKQYFPKLMVYLIENHVLRKWANTQSLSLLHTAKEKVSLDIYWEILWQVMDKMPNRKLLWEEIQSQASFLSSRGLIAMHHVAQRILKDEYISKTVGSHGKAIEPLFSALLHFPATEHLTEYWLSCYLEASQDKMDSAKLLIDNYETLLRLFPSLGLKILNCILAKSQYDPAISDKLIVELQIKLINTAFLNEHWEIYLITLEEVLKGPNRYYQGKTVCNLITSFSEHCIENNILLSPPEAQLWFSLLIKYQHDIGIDQFHCSLDYALSYSENSTISSAVLQYLASFLTSTSFKSKFKDIDIWESRLRKCPISSGKEDELYLKLLVDSELMSELKKVNPKILSCIIHKISDSSHRKVFTILDNHYRFETYQSFNKEIGKFIQKSIASENPLHTIVYCFGQLKSCLDTEIDLEILNQLEQHLISTIKQREQQLLPYSQQISNVLSSYYLHKICSIWNRNDIQYEVVTPLTMLSWLNYSFSASSFTILIGLWGYAFRFNVDSMSSLEKWNHYKDCVPIILKYFDLLLVHTPKGQFHNALDYLANYPDFRELFHTLEDSQEDINNGIYSIVSNAFSHPFHKALKERRLNEIESISLKNSTLISLSKLFQKICFMLKANIFWNSKLYYKARLSIYKSLLLLGSLDPSEFMACALRMANESKTLRVLIELMTYYFTHFIDRFNLILELTKVLQDYLFSLQIALPNELYKDYEKLCELVDEIHSRHPSKIRHLLLLSQIMGSGYLYFSSNSKKTTSPNEIEVKHEIIRSMQADKEKIVPKELKILGNTLLDINLYEASFFKNLLLKELRQHKFTSLDYIFNMYASIGSNPIISTIVGDYLRYNVFEELMDAFSNAFSEQLSYDEFQVCWGLTAHIMNYSAIFMHPVSEKTPMRNTNHKSSMLSDAERVASLHEAVWKFWIKICSLSQKIKSPGIYEILKFIIDFYSSYVNLLNKNHTRPDIITYTLQCLTPIVKNNPIPGYFIDNFILDFRNVDKAIHKSVRESAKQLDYLFQTYCEKAV